MNNFFSSLLILLFGQLLFNNAFAQTPGDVIRYKKIGNNLGGLGNVLSIGERVIRVVME